LFAQPVVMNTLSSLPRLRNESELVVLALLGSVVYGAVVLALFGRRWLALLPRRAPGTPAAPADAFESTSAPSAGPDPI
jgi:hypothetical protein